jgi:hypothetical protein
MEPRKTALAHVTGGPINGVRSPSQADIRSLWDITVSHSVRREADGNFRTAYDGTS